MKKSVKSVKEGSKKENKFTLTNFDSKIILTKTKKFFLDYKWFLIFFVPFLFLQVFHIIQDNWDTIAYVFGGKWFCGEQIYLELIRPPFPSFINCVFGAGDLAIVFSTILACLLYLSALILIYKKNKNELNQFVFALVGLLFPSILFYANFGSDLFALSFFLLALTLVNPLKKGFFFGLATLSRYNYLLFGLVLLFEERKKPKNILIILLVLLFLWTPWFYFNYLMTGNVLFSLEETIFLNVNQKGVIAPFFTEQLIIIGLFLLSMILTKLSVNSIKLNLSGLLNAGMFVVSGVKETRFINLLTPVIAFNLGKFFSKKDPPKKFLLALVVIGLLLIIIYPYPFYQRVSVPTDSFIMDCRVASDNWVFFYKNGIVCECIYDIHDLNEFLNEGGNLVLYHSNEFDLTNLSGEFIDRGEYLIIRSTNCNSQPTKYVSGSMRNNVLKWQIDSNTNFFDYSDWV